MIGGSLQKRNPTANCVLGGLSRNLSQTKGRKTETRVPDQPSVSHLSSRVQKERTINIPDALQIDCCPTQVMCPYRMADHASISIVQQDQGKHRERLTGKEKTTSMGSREEWNNAKGNKQRVCFTGWMEGRW